MRIFQGKRVFSRYKGKADRGGEGRKELGPENRGKEIIEARRDAARRGASNARCAGAEYHYHLIFVSDQMIGAQSLTSPIGGDFSRLVVAYDAAAREI